MPDGLTRPFVVKPSSEYEKPDARRSDGKDTRVRARRGGDASRRTNPGVKNLNAPITAAGQNGAEKVDADAVIMELAARQHGIVGRGQLLRAGVPSHAIDHRVGKGRLELVHRGVYRIGPLRSRYEREMAAVIACGETAVLSYRSAAGLWKLLPYRVGEDRVEVSVLRGHRVLGHGVRVHRISKLPRDERTSLRSMPVTVPMRTILDLAGSVGARELEQALAQAERRGLSDGDQLTLLLARHRRRSGTSMLRALLSHDADPAFTRSEAETQFLALTRKARLGTPDVNTRVRGIEVDFVWRAARLVVEVDGFEYHASSTAFEGDRRRDAVLAAAGFRVVRVTWRQLTREPEVVLVLLAEALARTPGRSH